MKFQLRHLLWGFTGYAFVQLIGYLGSAYIVLQTPMVIVFLMCVLLFLLMGVTEWIKAQSQSDCSLSKARVFQCFAGSFYIIGLMIFVLTIGCWIAN